MANRHRGEIEAQLDGTTFKLVLTLGALAELEDAFGDSDMLALAARFEKGRLSARDCMRVIAAGLRGAGHAVSDADITSMQSNGGAAGYVDIVARLLTATFGGGPVADQDRGEEANAEARDPFAGTS
ncbi:hypothetical protein HYPDE_32073 [Hyphomicrobium denitrificans 1NES1]|uniref:Transfer Agent n=1 Tax=Hyphomicrobium denitrificans 1NES1 TaxID=670307 RepID=N0B3K6_9HYPH|nr:gene transfer agent family protein [Hyphomicrobium denitrificans]AGK58089.1 hypothetical protein HYPDE_32073 [Hyphomicrobium denitrificans 1NES1]